MMVQRLHDSQFQDHDVSDVTVYQAGKLGEVFGAEEQVVLLIDDRKADLNF